MNVPITRVTILVPVFNAERHIEDFVSSLRSAAASSVFTLRVIFVLDGCEDSSEATLRGLLEQKMPFDARIVVRSERSGQQLTLKWALTLVEDPVCVIVDDDIALDSETLTRLVVPVSRSEVQMVVAQSKATGLRKLTSPVFWHAYRLVSGKVVKGRDLMLRSMSREIAESVSKLSDSAFSIATGSDSVSQEVARIPVQLPRSLAVKSRYSFADRFRLFTELIVASRRELGHAIVILASIALLLLVPSFILLSLFDLISLSSSNTLLAMIISILGLLNLIGIGLTQVSLGLLHTSSTKTQTEAP